jgi:hypothetical protein
MRGNGAEARSAMKIAHPIPNVDFIADPSETSSSPVPVNGSKNVCHSYQRYRLQATG